MTQSFGIGSLLALIIMIVAALLYPFWGWLIFLKASRQRENWLHAWRMQQDAKRQKETAELAAALNQIARAHGLVPDGKHQS